jgi:single-stranded-DNA-specific exonuclease
MSFEHLVDRLLDNRGVKKEGLYLSANQMPSPFEMKDMDLAVDIVVNTINNKQQILIVSDFDCDGATACATLLRGLVLLGCEPNCISFIVPDRDKHGYGLTPNLVDTIKEREFDPDLIITVDNGISSHTGIDAVRAVFPSTTILVTDHHLQAETLPNADAIVNPNRKDCRFPYKNIAGVGVAFFLLLAIKQKTQSKAAITSLLNIVAMGTVCDVVPMDALNRTIVKFGLQQIRQGNCIRGIKELASITEKRLSDFISSDFGFSLGPRINAAGRMADMTIGINLLLTDDIATARQLAKELDDNNKERKRVQRNMTNQAETLIKKVTKDSIPNLICLYDERWHQGVIGLLASTLKDKLYRPTFIFTKSGDGDIKASGRSIPGIHIRDLIERAFTKHPELGLRYGGHAMALGCSIKASQLELFKSAVEDELKLFDPSVFIPQIKNDGELPGSELTLHTAKALLFDIPWGQGFEPPLFKGRFTVENARMVGSDKNHLQFKAVVKGKKFTSIAFNTAMPSSVDGGGKGTIECFYIPQINEFNGNTSVQLLVDQVVTV